MMRVYCLLLLFSVVYASNKQQQVNELFNAYWKWRLFVSPTTATSIGYRDNKYASRLSVFTEGDINSRKTEAKMFLKKGRELQKYKTVLDEQTQLSLKLFIAEIQGFINGLPYKGYVINPVSFLQGPHKSLPHIVADTILKDENDYKNLLSRLVRVPEYIQQVIDMMKEGIRLKKTLHFYSMDGVVEQIKFFITEDQIYEKYFTVLPDAIPVEKRKMIQSRGRSYLNELVYPSMKKLAMFIKNEYMQHLRGNIAVSSLPDGDALYQQYLRYHTTTDMTPQQIHQLGITEVERIQKQLTQVITELGHPDMTVREFSQKLHNDSSTYYNSKDEVLSAFKNTIYNTIYKQLHKVFWTLPKQNITIKEDKNPQAYHALYHHGSSVSGRPSAVHIGTARYNTLPKHELLILCLHEGNPGHSFQFSFIDEHQSLPMFRRYPRTTLRPPSDFEKHDAFVEGWALYAETLGYDMGLYENDLMQKFGQLSYDILRAVRLVVDTGIHSLGWSREQAIQYMLEHTPKTRDSVTNEVNRYITLPGQACSYKVGQLKILELRKRSEESLGKKYDIRDFHETVLNCFGPMDILEQCVDAYIKKTLST